MEDIREAIKNLLLKEIKSEDVVKRQAALTNLSVFVDTLRIEAITKEIEKGLNG